MKNSTLPVPIFLVYAHADKEPVHKLFRRMVRDGIDVWLDSERLQPGQDWQHEIRKAILKSGLILVCLSRNFDQQPGYRHEELRIALEKASLLVEDTIYIIPVRLEECEMPESLRHLQRVDLFRPGGYKKLMYALKRPVSLARRRQ
jgi:hypothetical protein